MLLGYLKKHGIVMGVVLGLCVQWMLPPKLWIFVPLAVLTLLEKRNRYKVTLIILVLLEYLLILYIKASSRENGYSDPHKVFFTESSGTEVKCKPNLNEVLLFELDREKQGRFVDLAKKIYTSSNAIIFSCKIDEMLLNTFVTQVPSLDCYRARIGVKASETIQKKDVELTLVILSDKVSFFRVSYKRECAVLLRDIGIKVDRNVFKKVLQSTCNTGHNFNFVKFYAPPRWENLRRVMTEGSSPRKPRNISMRIRSMSREDQLRLYKDLGVDLRGYVEFDYLFITGEDLKRACEDPNP